ncbi:sugar MFS transporter [Granulicella sp. L46]|uniref:MFS transporter n=1 Tax=Granulicella sp. L46 TaxID=1641865 RepID=UPI0020B11772|nr:MFS transporter [Granulicella sp. L46]
MTQPTNSLPTHRDGVAGPSVVWLAIGFLLAGLGTVMLGPLMPTLLHDWRLTDQQGGLLLAAKFVGSFLGGVSVPRRLRLGVLGGMVFACAGFGAFALSVGLMSGAACLFVGGFGLGQIIASTNILIGRRYREHTGSALASVNFFWSLGAVLCGVIAAAALPRFHLRGPLLTFAGLFLMTGLGGLLNPSQKAAATAESSAVAAPPLPMPILTRFALLLFLYGGLETCMTGWLTTYTLRFSDVRLLGGQSAIVLLWSALTAGRALSSAALRVVREATLQRIGLALSALLIAALVTTRHGPLLSLYCVLLGLSLAPFFPTTFALLMKRRPTAREAGFILAVSGLGAALFPWLMGFVSTESGSLRVAMAVPLGLALILLILSFRHDGSDAELPNG